MAKKTANKRSTKGKGILKTSSDFGNGGVPCEARAIEIYTTKLMKEGTIYNSP